MERIRIPKVFLPVVAGVGLFACSSPVPLIETPTTVPPTRTPEPPPTLALPTSTSIPPRVEPTAIRTPIRIEPTPIPVITNEADRRIKSVLETAEGGQSLAIERAMVGHVARFLWRGGQFYLVSLEAMKSNNEKEILAWVVDSDCIFKDLDANGELGRLVIPGLWEVDRRIGTLDTRVSIAKTLTSPKPILDADSIFNHGQTRICEETKEKDAFIEFIKDAPENAGELVGWTTRKFLEGLRRGFNNP